MKRERSHDLTATKDGPALTLSDEKGITRAYLAADKKVGPALKLSDEKGKPRVR